MQHVQELNPPDDLPDYDQLPELPDVIPDWVLFDPIGRELPSCDCCGERHQPDDEGGVPAEWVAPDLAGVGWTEPGLPAPSPQVRALQAAISALEQVEATALGSSQALVDAGLLLQLEQQLRVQDLRRIADVKGRALHDLAGYRSTKTWLTAHRPDGDSNDADLASRLRNLPRLSAAVQQHRVPLASARKVAAVLRKITPHLDRPDGLIDGRPGEQVLDAVPLHVVTLLCRDLQGLHDDEPRLAELLAQADALAEHGQGDSQAARLEAACTWLAEQLPSRGLSGPLDELLMAILPSTLEERADRGHQRRGLELRPLPDGEGWHLCGNLDLECGERLWTALRAEAARDLRNPSDTAAWEEQRRAGTDDDVWGIDLGTLPRSRRQRLHDAMSRLLERYLAAGLGGLSGKAPVQIHVTLTEPTVTGQTGALPARADSGRLIPRGMVRRWWCDSSVSAYVLSLGGKALRVVHAQRTLTAQERRALATEGGGRCAGEGCCPSSPGSLVVLRPHHLLGYNEDQVTCLEETIPVCDTLHHDLHDGKKTVRLRDGRYLDEHGYRDGPALDLPPPF